MARSFNGTTDKIVSSNYAVPASITLSCWVNLTSVLAGNYGSYVIHNGSAGGSGHLTITESISASTVSWFVSASGGGVTLDPGSHTLTLGTWNHLLATYDSVGGLKTFVNNASDGTVAANGAITSTNGPMSIGADNFNAGRASNSIIAEIGEWNTPLSSVEIAALSNGARVYTIRPGSLIGYWPLDGLQSPEPDLSGNAHNGTVTGTTLAAGPPIMMFTPRQSMTTPFTSSPSFNAAWAKNRNTAIEGVAT